MATIAVTTFAELATAVNTTAVDGDVVELATGTYTMTANLTVAKSITVQAASGASPVINGNAGFQFRVSERTGSAVNVAITGLRFTNCNNNADALPDANVLVMTVAGTQNVTVTFTDCTSDNDAGTNPGDASAFLVQHYGGTCTVTANFVDCVAEDCQDDGFSVGGTNTPATLCVMNCTRCVSTGHLWEGFVAHAYSRMICVGCTESDNGASGYSCGSTESYMTVTHSRGETPTSGQATSQCITALSGATVVIDNCTFEHNRNGSTGILIDAATATVRSCTLTVIDGSFGISVDNAGSLNVNDCTVYYSLGSVAPGGDLYTIVGFAGTSLNVRRCMVDLSGTSNSNGTTHGIIYTSTTVGTIAGNVVITANTGAGGSSYGIRTNGGAHVISHNTVRGYTTTGTHWGLYAQQADYTARGNIFSNLDVGLQVASAYPAGDNGYNVFHLCTSNSNATIKTSDIAMATDVPQLFQNAPTNLRLNGTGLTVSGEDISLGDPNGAIQQSSFPWVFGVNRDGPPAELLDHSVRGPTDLGAYAHPMLSGASRVLFAGARDEDAPGPGRGTVFLDYLQLSMGRT